MIGMISADVPIPSTLIDSHVPLYKRKRSYVASDGTVQGERTEVKVYNASGACVKGGVYRLVWDGDEETNPKLADITAQTIDQYVVVALAATADATWGWFAIEGYVDALVDGDTTDVAKDDSLKVVTATNPDAFIQDQSGPTLSADTFAIACEANASTEALKKVYLLGHKADLD